MTYLSDPATYFPPLSLPGPAKCPECEAKMPLRSGRMYIAHFHEGNGVIGVRLQWLCSDKCFLEWEHSSLMGQA